MEFHFTFVHYKKNYYRNGGSPGKTDIAKRAKMVLMSLARRPSIKIYLIIHTV